MLVALHDVEACGVPGLLDHLIADRLAGLNNITDLQTSRVDILEVLFILRYLSVFI